MNDDVEGSESPAEPDDAASGEDRPDAPSGEDAQSVDADSGSAHSDVESAGAGDDSSEGDGAAGDPTAYTTDVRTLDPRVRWLWVGRSLLLGLIVGGILTGAILATRPAWVWVGGVAFAVVAGLGVAHAVLLYHIWNYEVREDSLFLDRGVVTRVQTVVPYVRVQHIDTSRGPIERAVGLSTLVVYTAGSRGADVTVPGLTPAEADDLQRRLKLLAIESEGEDAV